MCWEEWYLLVRLNAGAAEQNMFDHRMTKSRCKCGKGKRCWRRRRWRDREEKRKKEDYWKQKTSFKPCWIWYNWCSCFYFLMSTQAWSRAALLTRASRGLAWCQHKLLAWRTMKKERARNCHAMQSRTLAHLLPLALLIRSALQLSVEIHLKCLNARHCKTESWLKLR